jgi:hypothetical protein
MLVKNSEALRCEIMFILRREYDDIIKKHTDVIKDKQSLVHSNAFSTVVEQHLTCGKTEFYNLSNLAGNHPILPSIETAVLCFSDNQIDDSSYMMMTSVASNYQDEQYIRLVDENYAYNMKEPGFLPREPIGTYIGEHIYITYYADTTMLHELTIRTNIIPNDPDMYCDAEQMLLEPILEPLAKIWTEYQHYMTIHNYFLILFNELPSLNQMYKACPTILNYIYSPTQEKLFATIKDRNNDKLKELKPTDKVSVALGRNKLRGKH